MTAKNMGLDEKKLNYGKNTLSQSLIIGARGSNTHSVLLALLSARVNLLSAHATKISKLYVIDSNETFDYFYNEGGFELLSLVFHLDF